MNVQIKPELQRFIEDQVKSRRYDSADDAMNATVAVLQTEVRLKRVDSQR
ncbi:MAG TPA: hypothetical protein VK797_16140 [Tepidisphaeraceae bacterium]|jgi:Arc/MetJ-type ribon-helix-helix transcriptional regulator|nr:hypothetical protein [Tepidisphaeraceae bacterium]